MVLSQRSLSSAKLVSVSGMAGASIPVSRAAAPLAASLAIWIWLLDRQIVQQFEGRRWDLPAQVYARPLELYAGQRLGADEL